MKTKTKKHSALKPIRISKKELKIFQSKFDSIVLSVTKKIENFKVNPLDFRYGKKDISDYENLSKYGDYLGPVIKHNNNFYKCIRKGSIDDFKILWNTGIIQVLGDVGWVPRHVISEYSTKEYPIILKIQSHDLISYLDFNLDIAKSQIVFIALINQVLRHFGYKLHDAHYDNTCIINVHGEQKMIYIDVGSIVKINSVKDNLLTKNISKVEMETDIDAVVCGCYRILFSYFNDSLLSKYELLSLRSGEKYNPFHLYFEHRFYRRKFFFYHLFHSSIFVAKACYRIFKKLSISPIDAYILFLYKCIEFNEFESFLQSA